MQQYKEQSTHTRILRSRDGRIGGIVELRFWSTPYFHSCGCAVRFAVALIDRIPDTRHSTAAEHAVAFDKLDASLALQEFDESALLFPLLKVKYLNFSITDYSVNHMKYSILSANDVHAEL